ncbi:MAG: hypothetical protein V4536_08565 [Pseudomonadota bacterium]
MKVNPLVAALSHLIRAEQNPVAQAYKHHRDKKEINHVLMNKAEAKRMRKANKRIEDQA